MDSKNRGQTLTLSEPKMMKKRKKEPTRSEVLRKKRVAEGLVSAAASVIDHLSKLDAFHRCDGFSVRLDCGRGDRLSSPVKRYIQNLLKVNMEGPFGAEWPTEEKAKRREMVAPQAHYIFVWDDSGETMNKKLPDVGQSCEEDSLNLVGFVHFRFIVEEELPILYVYELQLEARIRGKGLGNFLMELIEVIARKNHMSAVVLTVQKANHSAMNFYTRKLRYEVSIISPSKVDPLLGMSASYEILCKAFEPEAKEVLEGIDNFMWLLIITSALLFWLASILLCVSRKSASIDNGGLFEGKNVLLVVAHPDDESMFFSPTLLYLTARGYNVHLLCLSTGMSDGVFSLMSCVGNADGKGDVRKHELLRACAVLGVPTQQVKILDHPNLQDGFGNDWDHSLLAKIVKEEVAGFGINVVITFDSYGVSGHCNHRDVHYGVWKLMLEASQRNIEAWELASTNILRKYSGPVDIWTSILCAYSKPARSIHLLTNEDPRKSYVAMSLHSSQWVWFRKLFLTFSSYTYINTLRRIHPTDLASEPRPCPETKKAL